MARFSDKMLAVVLKEGDAPPCPATRSIVCVRNTPPAATLHEQWEQAIAHFQDAVTCSPDCPLAPSLLMDVRDLAQACNPLAEVFPELAPARMENTGPRR